MPRNCSAEFKARLEVSPAPLCLLVKLTRTDGQVFGFTEFTKALTFNGTTYEASSLVVPSDLESSLDIGSADNHKIQFVLRSDAITEADLRSYKFDNCRLQYFVVFWDDLSLGAVQLPSAWFGNVTLAHGKDTAQAEFKGLDDVLNRKIVELTSPTCRYPYVGHPTTCKKDMSGVSADTGEPLTTTGATVSNAGDGKTQFTSSTLAGRSNTFYRNGRLKWTSGANNELWCEVKYNTAGLLTLKYPALFPIVNGDTFTIYAGCDFLHSTCKERFDWFVRFGGEFGVPGHTQNDQEG